MRVKVCHVTSNLKESYVLEAIGRFLDKDKYELSFVFLNPQPPQLLEKFRERNLQVKWIKYSVRRDLPLTIFRLRKYLAAWRPDIIHTHLVDASLAGLMAAALLGTGKRVHTRHHGSEAHKYYPRGVYYDKIVSRLSHRIMAITEVVRETLVKLDHVPPDKVEVIHYGYDFDDFATSDAAVQALRDKYDLNGRDPVVGVISRFVHWKGVQDIIPAFSQVAKKFPNAKLVLANAVGNYSPEIRDLLRTHLEPSQYVSIEYESDIFNLYKTFDVFVHVPIARDLEAFGQTYVEALYLEIPSVFTLSGVANDFIRDHENAVVVPYADPDAIAAGIELLLEDHDLKSRVVARGKADIEELFSGERFAADLGAFYSAL